MQLHMMLLGEYMENNGNNANLQNDVLHFEHHSSLSAEAITKAVLRHNREHQGDSNKSVQQAKASEKKR
jgi:hypothetical protein